MTDTGIVNIHGKQYHTVAKRVQDFREKWPNFGLTTEVAFRDGSLVAMKATITGEDGRILATGHAEEDRTKGQINRTSALENAETSAIGRALAAFGIGGTEFASANEVENAVRQQSEPAPTGPITDKTRDWLQAQLGAIPVGQFCQAHEIQSLKEATYERLPAMREWIKDQKETA